MEAEKFLERIKMIDSIIETKKEHYRRWKDIAYDINGFNISERVQSTKNPHKTTDAVDNYVDIEKEIESLQTERAERLSVLEKLSPVEYDFLYRKYIIGCKNREIAHHFGKSYDWNK